MRTVKQDFYNDFKCVADKCPATCCSGWQIMVDDKSLERYEKYSGKIPKRVQDSIDFEDGAIRQKDNRDCAFLNERGLCDWIIADGEDILCDTCRLYPRHVEEYEDLREWSISLSCPEAARLYLERESLAGFQKEENDEEDPLSDEFEDFDIILFSKLEDAREFLLEIAGRNDLSLATKLGVILALSEKLQRLYDSGDVFLMDDVIKGFSETKDLGQYSFDIGEFASENVSVFDELEILDEDWESVLDTLSRIDDCAVEDFEIENVSKKRHDIILSNLIIYYLYTYFYGSVYNGMIYGYAGMCVFGVIMAEAFAACVKKAERRDISLAEYISLIYRYSRETEHSDINIDAIMTHFDSQCV